MTYRVGDFAGYSPVTGQPTYVIVGEEAMSDETRCELAWEIVERLRDVNDEGPWMFTDQRIRDDMADWIEREYIDE